MKVIVVLNLIWAGLATNRLHLFDSRRQETRRSAYDGFDMNEHIIKNGINNNNHALYILLREHSQASYSLCQELSMTKCGTTCCYQHQLYHQSFRTHCNEHQPTSYRSPLQNYKINPTDGQKLTCQRTGRVYCGQSCCQAQDCETNKQDPANIFNLRFVNQICHEKGTNMEEQCKQSGLLWCDGTCCGFSASKHKCYRVNHFGTPFIRCPLQNPRK